jgi:hypothetical protein
VSAPSLWHRCWPKSHQAIYQGRFDRASPTHVSSAQTGWGPRPGGKLGRAKHLQVLQRTSSSSSSWIRTDGGSSLPPLGSIFSAPPFLLYENIPVSVVCNPDIEPESRLTTCNQPCSADNLLHIDLFIMIGQSKWKTSHHTKNNLIKLYSYTPRSKRLHPQFHQINLEIHTSKIEETDRFMYNDLGGTNFSCSTGAAALCI